MKVTVTGAGGFIGGHMVGRLLADGHEVTAVDSRLWDDWEQIHMDASIFYGPEGGDLSDPGFCLMFVEDADAVIHLGASMGGMGHIETHLAECAANIALDVNVLNACVAEGVGSYFFAGSACAYSSRHQTHEGPSHLAEWMVRPYDPEPGYGWSKLMGEKLAEYFRHDHGLRSRVARYHNIYGPHCAWDGGREKAPAAICRKVAQAVISGRHEIEIWGDGTQERSFCWVDDCVDGTLRLLDSDCEDVVNIGSSETVTVDRLVTLVEDYAGVTLDRRYLPDAPKGVPARSSDNTLIRDRLGWEPSTPLSDGMARLYDWVYQQVAERK